MGLPQLSKGGKFESGRLAVRPFIAYYLLAAVFLELL